MRLLVLGWDFDAEQTGGVGRACRGISVAMARLGASVTVLQAREDVVLASDAIGGGGVVTGAPGAETDGGVRWMPVEWEAGGAGRGGAGQPSSAPAPIPSPHPPRGDRTEPQSVAARAAENRSTPPAPQLLPIPTPLTPYLTQASYLDRAITTTAPASSPSAPPGSPHSVDPPPSPPAAPTLFAEVERYARAAARAAADLTFDLIHAHDWMSIPAAARIARSRACPLVFHVHSTEYDRHPSAPDPAILEVEARGLRIADRVVAVSRRTAEHLSERFEIDAHKLVVVHNGVDCASPDDTGAPLRTTHPIVLFLGRLTEQKNPLLFLQAASRIVHSEVGARPDVRFVLAGDGDLRPALEHTAQELGLTPHVHFTGALAAADVDRMYAVADLYVLPSTSEPFGISALEAMCQHTPALVARGSGVLEVLPEALTFDPADADDLADRILSVLTRPELHRSLAERGARRARTLRWELRARSLLRVFETLVP